MFSKTICFVTSIITLKHCYNLVFLFRSFLVITVFFLGICEVWTRSLLSGSKVILTRYHYHHCNCYHLISTHFNNLSLALSSLPPIISIKWNKSRLLVTNVAKVFCLKENILFFFISRERIYGEESASFTNSSGVTVNLNLNSSHQNTRSVGHFLFYKFSVGHFLFYCSVGHFLFNCLFGYFLYNF